LIKIIVQEENFKWHLEAFASELFIYTHTRTHYINDILFLERLHLQNNDAP